LAVFRSINHIYAQVIDDGSGKTLASASSVEKSLKLASGGSISGAALTGKAIAERALTAGIEQVVYDRGGYIYHGRVKALLDATREAGLNKNEKTDVKSSGKAEDKKTSGAKTEKKKPKPNKSAAKKEDAGKKKPGKKKEAKDSKEEKGKKPAPEADTKAAEKVETKDD
jgi:large subunit ribosomal protein L18